MDGELSEDERRALAWLRDKNTIQREITPKRSGKNDIQELDVSGGQAALIRILDDDKRPLHPELRHALAAALEPIGNSLLQLKKRLRRGPGRPTKSDSTRAAVVDAFEVRVVPAEIHAAWKALRQKRPQPAGGTKPRPVKRADAIDIVAEKRKISRSKSYELEKRNRDHTSKPLKDREK